MAADSPILDENHMVDPLLFGGGPGCYNQVGFHRKPLFEEWREWKW
jgi:hypothetical protein